MIFDNHAHLMIPVEKQIEIMNEAGINKTILFPTIIHPEKASNINEFENEYEKLINILNGKVNPDEERVKSINELVNVVKLYPDLFYGFGSCSAGMNYEKTSKWIENNIIKNNLIGIGEITSGTGQTYMIENIYKSVSDYNKKLPLWIHTFNPLNLDDIKQIIKFSKTYPDSKTILGHGGGYYWLETLKLIKDLKNIYIDISATFTNFSLNFFAKEMPDRILFGSDAPFGSPLLMKNLVEYVVKDKTIKEKIFYENLNKLLF